MQGQVLRCEDDGAYVECCDLFNESKEPLKDWIARSWAINQIQIPRTAAKLTAKENAVFEDPQCQHLALGISSFLKTLAKIQPLGLTADSLSRLGGESGNKVPWLTAKIVAGIKKRWRP